MRGDLLLEATGVTVDFGEVRAVAGVDLRVHAGEITALMGRNGCGKSTLLWALQGTGRRSGGSVRVAGDEVADPAALGPAERRRHIALVPQTASDLLYHPTVAQELAASDHDCGRAASHTRQILDRLVPGIRADLHPRDLSEGQRLALVLALQLAAAPPVILLDEPTRGLDYPAKDELAAALRRLAGEGHAVLVATHDVEFAATCADRVLVMAAGEIVADGEAAAILASSPAYAPQVAKVTADRDRVTPWLTVADVVAALPGGVAPPRTPEAER